MPLQGFVQGNKGTATGAASMTLAFPGACAAGNFIGAEMQSANTVGGTVSDNVNAGNYSVANNHSTANTANDLALFYKENIAHGTPAVTFTPGSAGDIGASIGEYAGVVLSSSIDKNGATEGNGTSLTSGSLTNTGANGDLILGCLSAATQNVTVTDTTPGWSLDENNTPNATMSAVLGSRVQSPAAAFTTTFGVSGSAQDLCLVVASFKLAPLAVGGYSGFGPATHMRPPTVPGGLFKAFNPLPVASSGPVSNVVTATDNLSAMSDTATRILSLIRTASDTLAAISDTAVRIVSLPRTVVDNLAAMSDTATRILSLTRTVSESLASLSDTATRAAQSFLRTASDTLSGLTETASRASQSFLRTATDNLPSMSDTASAIKVIIRSATDNLSAMSDTATRAAMTFLRSGTDNLSALSETITRVSSFARSVSDSLAAISESAVRSVSFPRSLSESLSAISDVANRILSAPRAPVDNLAVLSDQATRSAQTFIRSVVETISGVVDTATNTGALTQTFVQLINYIRDGSLISRIRDGSLISSLRDASRRDKTRG